MLHESEQITIPLVKCDRTGTTTDFIMTAIKQHQKLKRNDDQLHDSLTNNWMNTWCEETGHVKRIIEEAMSELCSSRPTIIKVMDSFRCYLFPWLSELQARLLFSRTPFFNHFDVTCDTARNVTWHRQQFLKGGFATATDDVGNELDVLIANEANEAHYELLLMLVNERAGLFNLNLDKL